MLDSKNILGRMKISALMELEREASLKRKEGNLPQVK
jgi:hypothetical protein